MERRGDYFQMKTDDEIIDEVLKKTKKEYNGNFWKEIKFMEKVVNFAIKEALQLARENQSQETSDISREGKALLSVKHSRSDTNTQLQLQKADFEKMIDEKYNENKKFWLKYHNEEDKHAEDIFYNIMRAFEELKQKLREEK